MNTSIQAKDGTTVSITINEKFLILLLGMLTALDPLSIDMYLPAFEDIKTQLGTTMSMVELSVSTFFIGMAFGQLIYGPLSDRFGRKRPLFAGMILYFVATLGCAVAPNIESFIALRFLQSLGGCAGMTITRAIIRDLYDKNKVASFLSNMALIMGLAPILAPSIGAFINAQFGWRAIFYFLCFMNLSAMTMLFFFLPESNHQRTEVLKIGHVLKSCGGLLKNKNFMGYLISDTGVRAGMFAYIAGSPYVFIQLLGIPQKYYGLIFGINGLGLMLTSQLNRKLLQKYTPEKIISVAVRFAAFAALVVFVLGNAFPSKYVILPTLFLFIISLNFISPNTLAGALSSQAHQAGVASAMYGCSQWCMATISSFIVGHFHNGTAYPMTGAILICGIISTSAYQFLLKPTLNRPQFEETA